MFFDVASTLVLPAAAFPFPMEFTLPRVAVFTTGMVISGFLIGRLLGDEFRLFAGVRRGPPGIDPAVLAVQVTDALKAGDAHPATQVLIDSIRSPNEVAALFPGDRVQALVALLQESPGASDPSRKTRWDQLYALLAHITAYAPEDLRLPLACTLGRALPAHRGLTAPLLESCRRHPGLWNDLQARFDEAASRDAHVEKFLETHAGSDQAFVRKANDQFMNEMERFRRLCEDKSAGMSVVTPELRAMIDREMMVLELSRSASRRFMWLSSNARVTLRVFTAGQVDVLESAVRQGVASACALAARGVIVWALDEETDRAVRMVEALTDAAAEHSTAVDALFGLIHGIRQTRNHSKLNGTQLAVRRLAFENLQGLAKKSYEVRTTLLTHGLLGSQYEDPGEEDVTLDSTAI
jgi:hypothetical protein